MASIDRRFKLARADKERALAETRRVETETARHRSEHLRLQFARERKEYILLADAVREWNESLNALKINLYTIPDKFSTRWASLDDDLIIHEELKSELDRLFNSLAERSEALGKSEYEKLDEPETQNEVI